MTPMPNAGFGTLPAHSRPFGPRPNRKQLWESRESFFTDAALFLLGVAGLYSVNLIGAIPGCELLLLAMLPVLALEKGSRAFDRQYLYFYLAVGGWLLGTLIADEYNDIWWQLRAKGVARVVFFAIDFVGLAILLNNRTRRFIIFIMSLGAVLLIGSREFSSDFSLQWKFGLSHATTIASLLISTHFYTRRRYWVCFSIALCIAGLNFHYGARSQLLIDMVSTVLILPILDNAGSRTARPIVQRNYLRRPSINNARTAGKPSLARTLALLGLAMVTAYMLNFAIKFAAQKGVFDESNNEKFQAQASGDYGVLVGGRPETLVAIQAIIDSPIIGHGSFPYGVKYLQMEKDIQFEHGYSDSDDPEETDSPVIPTHSHLTLGWVEGGILGGVCWIYIFILVLRALLRLATERPAFAPVYAYMLVNFLWDILYSPFGSVNRIQAAFFILLSYSLLRNGTSSVRSNSIHFGKAIYRPRVVVQRGDVWQPGFPGGRS
jgi:hypothetical protein